MQKTFFKMHGLGNDFVIIDGRVAPFALDLKFICAIADRKRGVGCDQVIILQKPKSPVSDVYLDMYNADGSSLRACGNATRCVARLLFEELGRSDITIETVAGLLRVTKGKSGLITVDMGKVGLDWDQIPLAKSLDTLHVPLELGKLKDPCCVNVGNPHAVFFVPDVAAIPLSDVGPNLENDPIFPDRCNIEIAQILAPDRIRMRVWERGAGITLACGSGACAVLVAAVRRQLSARKATIVMDGGDAIIEWREDNHVLLTGPAAKVFEGKFMEELLTDLSLQAVA